MPTEGCLGHQNPPYDSQTLVLQAEQQQAMVATAHVECEVFLLVGMQQQRVGLLELHESNEFLQLTFHMPIRRSKVGSDAQVLETPND
jgi:hypothetical protein